MRPAPLFLLLLLVPLARADPRCDACETQAAALAPPAPPPSPTLVPLVESLGLCLVGAVGVAAGCLLARRA